MNNIIDIILFPMYVALFALLFAWRRKKIKDPLLKKYHLIGFWIKVFGAFAYIIFSLKLAKVDSTFLYFPEGVNFIKLILKDVSNIKILFSSGKDFDPNLLSNSLNRGYFNSESNYFIAKLVALFSLVSFGNYSVITLIFSMISFSGVWRLYRFFYEQYPHLHKQLAIAILYLPNFVFWSSGILKDPLCTGMLGWFTYSMYAIFIKKRSILKYSLAALVSAALIGLIKSYIITSYIPFIMLFLIGSRIKNIDRPFVKAMMVAAIILTLAGGLFLTRDLLLEEAVNKLTESVYDTQQNFIGLTDYAESTFSLGVEFEPTPAGLLKIAPAGIVASLYRPYLWEAKGIASLMSAVESFMIMLFTLYVLLRAGPFFFIKSFIKDPMIMYCLLFALVFALFVGVTTLNFGTLVRYKIPCMPFYLIALMLVLEKYKTKKLQKAAAKEIIPVTGQMQGA